MGTKNNPGKYDCYANAAPDEPMFILLGRDPFASALVDQWAISRAVDGEDTAKVSEAFDLADMMRRWLRSHGKTPKNIFAPHSQSASLRHFGDGETAIRCKISCDGNLIVDMLSRSVDFADVLADAVRCMQHPALHFSVDLSMPDGSPFPLESRQ